MQFYVSLFFSSFSYLQYKFISLSYNTHLTIITPNSLLHQYLLKSHSFFLPHLFSIFYILQQCQSFYSLLFSIQSLFMNQPTSLPVLSYQKLTKQSNPKTQQISQIFIGQSNQRLQKYKRNSFYAKNALEASDINLNNKQSGISNKSKHKYRKHSQTPGPGTYDPHYQKIKKCQPAFKLPICKKFNQFQNIQNIPGPGSYDIQLNPTSKHGLKFGHQKRNSIYNQKQMPGPSTYQKQTQIILTSNPKFSFGNGHRITSESNIEMTPGPGSYQKKGDIQFQVYKKKGYSIASKIKQHLENLLDPGPGSYDTPLLNKLLKQTPSYSIGNSGKYRVTKIQTTPGPMDYKPQLNVTKSKTIIIGRCKRLNLLVNNIPGPGSYEKKDFIGIQGPKFTINQSKSLQKKIDFPGPGQYNPNIIKQNQPKVVIGTSPRLQIKNFGPGPCDYKIDNDLIKNKGFSIGHERRDSILNKSITPGPGQYQIPPLNLNKGKNSKL